MLKLNSKFTTITLAGLAVTVLMIGSSTASASSGKGFEIASEWDARDQGFGDTRANLRMVLENRHGQKSERKMRMKILEVPDHDQGDKSLVIFDHPRDVKGTAFLSFAHIKDPDDQWLYLPALKRVKRISSKNKSGPFLGSEFAYEDFSAQELNKYEYTWLRDEVVDGEDHFVIEQTPTYASSGYTKMVVWYDKAEYRQRKIDYYDRKGDLLKTLTFSKYKKHLDKYWRAYDMFMVNHQTGKKTRLAYSQIDFKTGVTARDLSKNSLKRAR